MIYLIDKIALSNRHKIYGYDRFVSSSSIYCNVFNKCEQELLAERSKTPACVFFS